MPRRPLRPLPWQKPIHHFLRPRNPGAIIRPPGAAPRRRRFLRFYRRLAVVATGLTHAAPEEEAEYDAAQQRHITAVHARGLQFCSNADCPFCIRPCTPLRLGLM